MKFIQHTFLSICCLLTVNIAAAQFSIYGTAGLSGLKYKVEGGTQNAEIGYGGGMGYSFKLSSTETSAWRTGLAVEVTTVSNKVRFGVLSEQYEHGTGNDRFMFSYSLNDYEEKQNIMMLSVPLTLQYQKGGKARFCISGGVKFGLPITAETNITPGTATASGKFDYEGLTYTNLPQHSFPDGTKLPEIKRDIDLKYSIAATGEIGLLVKKFYLGLYLDYGLNDMQKTKNKHPLEYEDSGTSMFAYNSILNTDMVDKINLFSTGLKIKIQF
jgi:hypothetical protein